MEEKVVEGVGLEVDLHRLGELAHDGPVLPVEDVEDEHPPLADELVGEGLDLEGHPHQLGVGGQLGDQVAGHPVAPVARPAAQDEQAAGHAPQHPAAELVVLLGLGALGDGPHDPVLYRHAEDATEYGG